MEIEIRSVELDPMDTDHILLGIPDTPENRKFAREILGETVTVTPLNK